MSTESIRIHRSPLRRIPLRQTILVITLASLASAVLIFGFLALQMYQGEDPALGPKLARASTTKSAGSGAATLAQSEAQAEADAEATILAQQQAQAQAAAPTPAAVQTATS